MDCLSVLISEGKIHYFHFIALCKLLTDNRSNYLYLKGKEFIVFEILFLLPIDTGLTV